ncbi:MAG: PD-(D/E)XK nuclease family protein [Fimbriimonadaceae bacterium]|nr:PD-(D/E)XK nuclease family protein [Fimbriimonadaceae bacterium]
MRKPTLSPSKITTFLACPVKYIWTYVNPKGRLYFRAKRHYSFGTSLHRVLEQFHDVDQTGVTTVEEAIAAVEENWIEAGYESPQAMADALGEGKELVERYVKQALSAERVGVTKFVEKAFRYDMGDFTLSGRIDRIDEFPDGSWEIIDYKTGRENVEPEDVKHDIAMNCYQLMVQRAEPDREVRTSIVAVRSGRSAVGSLSPAELDEFEVVLRDLGRTILATEQADLSPHPKRLCHGCDFLPLCRTAHAQLFPEDPEFVLPTVN